jgi:hypothetical protein
VNSAIFVEGRDRAHDPPVSASEAAEFPVPQDTAAYYLGTFGFVMIVMAGASVVAAFFGMARPGALDADEMMAIVAAVGVLAGAWWIRRWYRINHERKLVLDGEGIVYVKFADRRRVIRWHEIERVIERVDLTSEGDSYSLVLDLSRGRFRIRDHDFVGYWHLRKLIEKRLPSKTILLSEP